MSSRSAKLIENNKSVVIRDLTNLKVQWEDLSDAE